MKGFTDEAVLALQLGFKGKLLIHPTQIEIANNIFSPSPDEVEHARKIVEVFEEAQARGLGAVSFEGKMVDYMNYNQAKDLVNLMNFIMERENKKKQTPYISLSQFFAQ